MLVLGLKPWYSLPQLKSCRSMLEGWFKELWKRGITREKYIRISKSNLVDVELTASYA
jgi:hypothetical protein